MMAIWGLGGTQTRASAQMEPSADMYLPLCAKRWGSKNERGMLMMREANSDTPII
jgi:hypothetical protein